MVSGDRRVVETGFAYSVEPGIYIPGKLGLRLEDIVVATDDGPISLNEADHNLHESDRLRSADREQLAIDGSRVGGELDKKVRPGVMGKNTLIGCAVAFVPPPQALRHN